MHRDGGAGLRATLLRQRPGTEHDKRADSRARPAQAGRTEMADEGQHHAITV